MQWIIFAVIMLHGFIHLMGFIKGSGIKEVKELSKPVSKTVGLCWFTATILFIWFAISLITHSDHAWLIGLIAIVVSQLLIVTSWKDARFGTLPNVFLLVVCVFLLGSDRFHQQVHCEAVNEQGAKLDEATMQRYLGEMVWFPSMALSEYISWESSNDTSATATMEYKGTRASGTFYFNAHGDVTKFSAMRYMGNDPDAGKYEWVMAIEDYAHFEGVKVPVNMTATWKLEDQDWTWLKLDVTDLRFNENVKF